MLAKRTGEGRPVAGNDLLPEGIFTNIAVFIGTAVAAATAYFAGKTKAKSPQEPLAQLHISDASVTDMLPVRQVAEALLKMADQHNRSASALEGILELMAADAKDRSKRYVRAQEEEFQQLKRDKTERERAERQRKERGGPGDTYRG